MQSKCKEQLSGHTFRPKKKQKVGDNSGEKVTINIGLMNIVDDDLKPIWVKNFLLLLRRNLIIIAS